MGRPKGSKNSKPAEGGAVGGGEDSAVRPPITQMLSSGSDADFEKSLPSSTATVEGDEPRKRKPRQPKPETEVDPLMSDPLYRQYVSEMMGFGGPDLIGFACTATGKPMDDEEERRVKGLFYVAGKRSNIDPGQSWLALFIVAVATIIRLVIARTDLAAQIKKMFEPAPKEEKKPEAQVVGNSSIWEPSK